MFAIIVKRRVVRLSLRSVLLKIEAVYIIKVLKSTVVLQKMGCASFIVKILLFIVLKSTVYDETRSTSFTGLLLFIDSQLLLKNSAVLNINVSLSTRKLFSTDGSKK